MPDPARRMPFARPALAPILLFALALPAGAQWTPQTSGTDAEFRGLSVVGPRIVWASGTRGRVAHTTDGGRTWRVDSIPGAARLDLRSIHAFDERTAVAASAGESVLGQANIFRTENGGRTWKRVFTTETVGVFLDAIAFWDSRHGIVLSDPVDGKFFLLRTDDGGRTWSRIPPDALPPVLPGEAAFAASGSCLTVRGSSEVWIGTGGAATARVFHSSDRGATWSVADTPVHAGDAASGIFSVAFRDVRNGVAIGGDYSKPRQAFDNVALTTDGGATWTRPAGPLPAGYFSAVAWVPGSVRPTLVAVGLAGTAVSADGGQSWTVTDTIPYNSIRFGAPRVGGWTVGPKGRIARWSGGSWLGR